MKRLFVSLMVIGGFILFGMQAAESAPKKQTIRRLTQRAERCAKRAKTAKENKRCFDRLVMEESKIARIRRDRACGKLSPVAKKACRRRFGVKALAKKRALARSRGTLIFLLAPKCGKLNPKAKAACLLARARVKDRVRTRVKDRVRDRVNKSSTAARRDCNRFTTERARRTCRGLPAAKARAKAAGCSKLTGAKRSICFRQAKMCGDIRDPKKRAKCRARVKARMKGMAKRDAARRACARVPKASRSACLRKAKKRN